jgi:hypothetical protein
MLLRLLALARAPGELAEAEVAVGDEGTCQTTPDVDLLLLLQRDLLWDRPHEAPAGTSRSPSRCSSCSVSLDALNPDAQPSCESSFNSASMGIWGAVAL